MTDSFAHHVRIEQIRDGELFELSADEAECDAVAQRLGLQALTGWRRGRCFTGKAG